MLREMKQGGAMGGLDWVSLRQIDLPSLVELKLHVLISLASSRRVIYGS